LKPKICEQLGPNWWNRAAVPSVRTLL